MDVDARIELVRELCSFEDRRPGTDAERRAANWLAKRLRASGRRADVESTYVHPQFALIQAGHCLLGAAGSLLAIAKPGIGFALVLAAAASMYLDVNARFLLLRRVLFRRASQNVVSPGTDPSAPARVILTAHYDAARTGAVFNAKNIRRAARIDSALPFPTGGFRPIFWSLAALLPILGARMAGVDAEWLSIVQVPPTLTLVVAIFLLCDIELSESVPAANDNGSGVATALSLAAELDADPPEHLDLWVVLTGAEECLYEGMRSFLRTHRAELDPETTFFVNIDSVGGGDVRYLTSEGTVVAYDLDRRLVQICDAIAAADRNDENRLRAEPLRSESAADSLPVRLSKRRAITISCVEPGARFPPNHHLPTDTPDNLDAGSLDRAHDFAHQLVRQLDRDVGRRSESVIQSSPAGVDSR